MTSPLSVRANLPELEPWEGCLLAAAGHRLRLPSGAPAPASADTADCRLVLRARGDANALAV